MGTKCGCLGEKGKRMNQEEEFLQKRIMDLANQSYRNQHYTFSGFLSLGEQELVYQALSGMDWAEYTLFGGMEGCERQMVRFGSEQSLGYEEPFPIICIEIAPRMVKFADNLSHRDFLGALMHLGIERSTLGDILVKEKTAFLFCQEKVRDFIVQNLDKIRHTSVLCRVCDEIPEMVKPALLEESLIVSSERLDGIVAKLYHLSRSQSILLFREKKVFVNGRCMENNSGVLKEGDVVSVRGYGKFVYEAVQHETRKGRLSIRVSRYH